MKRFIYSFLFVLPVSLLFSQVFTERATTVEQSTEAVMDCPFNTALNWVEHLRYDENGKVIAASRTYLDGFGRVLQVQEKIISTSSILISQPLYDAFGREAGQSLPAPSPYSDFCYQPNFISNTANAPYDYRDFDLPPGYAGAPGETDNPKPCGDNTPGTLGWYYSNNNNTEPLVAADGFPYARIVYDQQGLVQRLSEPGRIHQPGRHHEDRYIHSSTASMAEAAMSNELQLVFLKRSYELAANFDPATYGNNTYNTNLQLFKSIHMDADGRDEIRYSNTSGHTIATCHSSKERGSTRFVNRRTLYTDSSGFRSSEVYLASGQTDSLFFFLTDNTGTPHYNNFSPVILDKFRNLPLRAGIDYQYDSHTGHVQFIGNYASIKSRPLYLSLSAAWVNGFAVTAGCKLQAQHPVFCSQWQLYFYDRKDRLLASLSPEEVISWLTGKNTNIPFSEKNTYDEYDRLVRNDSKEEGSCEYIYDPLEDKVLFSQNDEQKLSGRFSCIQYDAQGRVIRLGDYNPNAAGQALPLKFQSYGDYKNGLSVTGAINARNVAQSNHYNYNDGRLSAISNYYYDVSDANLNALYPSSFPQQHLGGRLSHSSNDNSNTWYSYDPSGRVASVLQNAIGIGFKTLDYSYDVWGKLLTRIYQRGNSQEYLAQQWVYDADERLSEVRYGRQAGGKLLPLAHYNYYAHGPLKRCVLGNQLQGLDYTYTIEGLLKSVNNPMASTPGEDPGQDGYAKGLNAGVSPDLFAYTLDYYPGDYARNNALLPAYNGTAFEEENYNYTGLIRAQRWKTALPAGANSSYTGAVMYEYRYDEYARLLAATFGSASIGIPEETIAAPVSQKVLPSATAAGVSTAGQQGQVLFAADKAYALEQLRYDANGNLQSLLRRNGSGLPMDNLAYVYDSTRCNRLIQVRDSAGSLYSAELDLPNQGAGNYSYNVIGQLSSDRSSTLGYEYTPEAQIKRIFQLSDGSTRLSFTYNERGQRNSKTVYSNGGVAQTVTYFLYDPEGQLIATYDQASATGAAPTLSELILYANGRVGSYQAGSNKICYELSDHLGNVRGLFTNNGPAAQMLSYADYYPQGGVLPNRHYESSVSYRYGYQGKEKDQEVSQIHFELRQYDARIGRWLNPDPYRQHASPYAAMANNPVNALDPDGGMDYRIDGMVVSEHTYNTYVGNSGGNFSVETAGLSYGTTIGYSYNGQQFYGNKAMTKAVEARENAYREFFETQGWNDVKKTGEYNYLQFYRDAQGQPTQVNGFAAGNGWLMTYQSLTELYNFNTGTPFEAQSSAYLHELEMRGTLSRWQGDLRARNLCLFADRAQEFIHDATWEVMMAISGEEAFNLAFKGYRAIRASKAVGELSIMAGREGGLNLFKWGARTTTKSEGWKIGDYMLHLPNKGTPKLNWKANYGALRREMKFGNPIYETFVQKNGALKTTGGFLNAERFTLQSRGWIYNPTTHAWAPPIK